VRFSKLASNDVGWMSAADGENSCVISTRIRLARNLKKYPFPAVCDENTLRKIRREIFAACKEGNILKNAEMIKLEECDSVDRQLLLERHHISHEHAHSSDYGGLVLGDREMIGIMINEEDHLRIQYISGGLSLLEAWDIISKLDDELSKSLDFAYSDKWGYLTACPTNTGTGIRASCQLHLPALGMTGGIKGTMENINKMGMVVRGLYGEGTKVMGNMVQISNQVTLGITEERIIDNLKRLVTQVIDREKRARETVIQSESETLKDVVYRSWGLLTNAYKMSFEEALDLLSNIRFGIYSGIMKEINMGFLNNLMIKIQPAHLQESRGREMKPEKRDIVRADLIRDFLKGKI